MTSRDKYHYAHLSKDKRAAYFHANDRPDSSKAEFFGHERVLRYRPFLTCNDILAENVDTFTRNLFQIETNTYNKVENIVNLPWKEPNVHANLLFFLFRYTMRNFYKQRLMLISSSKKFKS